jgi:hypothetical protein
MRKLTLARVDYHFFVTGSLVLWKCEEPVGLQGAHGLPLFEITNCFRIHQCRWQLN